VFVFDHCPGQGNNDRVAS